jgi:hypothetical protein
VRMRSRKPWVLARRRLFGWKVRLLTTAPQQGQVRQHRRGEVGRSPPATTERPRSRTRLHVATCSRGRAWACDRGRRQQASLRYVGPSHRVKPRGRMCRSGCVLVALLLSTRRPPGRTVDHLSPVDTAVHRHAVRRYIAPSSTRAIVIDRLSGLEVTRPSENARTSLVRGAAELLASPAVSARLHVEAGIAFRDSLLTGCGQPCGLLSPGAT